MIRTVFFDMGGTLDGDGQHWLERFLVLYKSFGIELPRAALREAFDAAEKKAATDERMASASLQEMIERHVQWQLHHLGLTSDAAVDASLCEARGLGDIENHSRVLQSKTSTARALERHLVEGFLEPVRTAVAENARLLAALHARGFVLGVISNGCGNVAQLCAEFGYAPFLSLVVDSRRVGLAKPDPAIYSFAAEKIGGDVATMLMVGDSYERDILPAKKIGMKTAWLKKGDCPDPSAIDFRLQRLAELPALLP